MKTNLITFAKATLKDLSLMTSWWKERPHILEFWDNSDSTWQNCYNYLHGNKDEFDYWIASYEGTQFSLVMSSNISEYVHEQTANGNLQEWFKYVPKHGKVIGFDFMIAEPAYLGKGLAPQTLKAFMDFLLIKDRSIVAFYIDPEEANFKAIRAYSNAGFEKVGSYSRDFGGRAAVPHQAMVCKVEGSRSYE